MYYPTVCYDIPGYDKLAKNTPFVLSLLKTIDSAAASSESKTGKGTSSAAGVVVVISLRLSYRNLSAF
jgi:hypothetical protein